MPLPNLSTGKPADNKGRKLPTVECIHNSEQVLEQTLTAYALTAWGSQT